MIEKMIERAEETLAPAFALVQKREQLLFERVLGAFQEHCISLRHFNPSTGYGYGDDARDTFEKVFAMALGAPDALVRPGIASGTHALAVCLFALLRPGQTLLYASGAPYDTLHSVIGIQGQKAGSLLDYQINYRQADLLPDGELDTQAICQALANDPSIGLVAFQRSRGYSWRPTISIAQLADAIAQVRSIRADVPIMVDNCYGEFVEELEPYAVGADVMVGSLIKNPGGGLAPTGGYIAGRADYVELCANRLTAPGVGREIGSWASGYQAYYQGLYMAPHTVTQALMGAMLASAVFSQAGYTVSPTPLEERGDIIQAIQLNDPAKVIAFCRAIQAASPVDSHVVPEPWGMPGYDNDVIMAAGTFVGGASIELSADAPMREPYIVYLQGALTYAQARYGVKKALQALSG